MSLRKRLIACLDVTDGRVVKGTRFADLQDAGDAVELATRYAEEGADEIVILDVGATQDRRPALLDLISRAATALDVPLGVGGGVASLADAAAFLDAGADKVSVNSAALRDPGLLDRIAARLGSQSLVISIDAARAADGSGWSVRGVSGTADSGREAVAWAREAVERGAGEVLLTSIDRDGTRSGYDLELTRAVSDAVPVPVIASGGAGSADDILAALDAGGASAALLASLLHRRLVTIPELKAALAERGLPVRPLVAAPTPERGGRVAWVSPPPGVRDRPAAGGRPGRRLRRGADAGLGQCRGRRRHRAHRRGAFLVPIPGRAVAQGRHERERDARGRAGGRLRCRRHPVPGPSCGSRMPHRIAFLLHR